MSEAHTVNMYFEFLFNTDRAASEAQLALPLLDA